MSLCPFELDALGLGGSRVGRLGRLRSPHAPQSSNLSRVYGSLNPTRLVGNEIELGMMIPTIESQASTIPMTKGIMYVVIAV